MVPLGCLVFPRHHNRESPAIRYFCQLVTRLDPTISSDAARVSPRTPNALIEIEQDECLEEFPPNKVYTRGAMASTVVLALVFIRELHDAEDALAKGVGIVVATLFPLTGAVLMMAGALRMMLGRNTYLLCVAAALLAVLP
jgi:hypothetical protein